MVQNSPEEYNPSSQHKVFAAQGGVASQKTCRVPFSHCSSSLLKNTGRGLWGA